MEKIEILATLPPKSKVDELVRQFFDQKNWSLATPRKSGRIPCRAIVKLMNC
jgi:hypothetical protein